MKPHLEVTPILIQCSCVQNPIEIGHGAILNLSSGSDL